MNKAFFILALTSALGLGACDRPTVVTVPAPVAVPGPAGPAGATGSAGIDGGTGATGATGKAGEGTTVIVMPATSAPSNP